jgi:hypothetical protein
MHGHTLARGGTVRVDATMFSVEELEQLARAATRSGYHCKVKIFSGQALSQREKASILAAVTDQKRVVFASGLHRNGNRATRFTRHSA